MTQQPMQQPPYAAAPNHPQATTVLVLGILSLVVCGIIGPFAWSMGNRVVREIDSSAGQVGGRTEANVGRILGIVATVLLAVGFVLLVLLFVFGAVISTGFSTGSGWASAHEG